MEISPTSNEVVYSMAAITLYPQTRTQRKAERVLDDVQRCLSHPLVVHACNPHPYKDEGPLYRIDAILPLEIVGTYPALAFLLEFLQPIAQFWEVSLPHFGYPMEGEVRQSDSGVIYPSLSWTFFGHTKQPEVAGLNSVHFSADSSARY